MNSFLFQKYFTSKTYSDCEYYVESYLIDNEYAFRAQEENIVDLKL